MSDRRKHQRIRFSHPLLVRIGYGGRVGEGKIENLSLSGLMLISPFALTVGHVVGCEFSLAGWPRLDVAARVVSHVGDCYGVRIEPGLIAPYILDEAIPGQLASGQAATLSFHTLAGKHVMRVVGGLSAMLSHDFMHALTRMGVHELDLSAVTAVDSVGLGLCRVAVARHGVHISARSDCFAHAWATEFPSISSES